MALPRSLRFSGRRGIQAVLRRGRRMQVPLGRAMYLPTSDGRGRTLFVIAKAVIKKSSDRNRIKRRLDERLRRHYGARPPGADVVVFVQPPAATASAAALRGLADQTFAALEGAYKRR